METIKLSKPLMIKGEETKEVKLDFNSLTGKQLIDAEREARLKGDQTPSVFLSMTFQAIVAGKLIGVLADEIEDLPATDFRNLVMPVADRKSVV